jgi:hypothetical protein
MAGLDQAIIDRTETKGLRMRRSSPRMTEEVSTARFSAACQAAESMLRSGEYGARDPVYAGRPPMRPAGGGRGYAALL